MKNGKNQNRKQGYKSMSKKVHVNKANIYFQKKKLIRCPRCQSEPKIYFQKKKTNNMSSATNMKQRSIFRRTKTQQDVRAAKGAHGGRGDGGGQESTVKHFQARHKGM